MNADEFWAHVDTAAGPDGCWPWMAGNNGNGRGRLPFGGRMQYAYRVAWEITHDEAIPADLEACHTCDNPICVNPAHIFPGTRLDNALDAVTKGRAKMPPTRSGVEHHLVTVTPELVARAVNDYVTGDERQEDVAARYGIAQSTFSRWVNAEVRADAGLSPSRKPFKPCGTRAAYERHRRRGEAPCEPCRSAELAEQRQRRANRRGRAA